MDFGFSEAEETLRREVKDFLGKEMTSEVTREAELSDLGPATFALLRKLGAKRWLAPSWPKEYGGLEASPMERYLIREELNYQGASMSLVGVDMAGPTILLYGTEQQKREYLPRIAGGEIEFALGYTEPQAGSDLASLELRAVRDGDDFILNGQKVFNTSCHYAAYHWVGARTDPTARKHQGISLFIVDLKSPGITVRPLWTMAGVRTNEVFYDDVRVPKGNLVGEPNKGWHYIGTALDFERSSTVGATRRYFEQLVEYAKNGRHEKRPIDDPLIQHRLSEIAAEISIGQLLCRRVAWMQTRGMVSSSQAAMAKIFTSELTQRLANLGMQIAGPCGQLESKSKFVPLQGRIGHSYLHALHTTIVRGTSEIMRNTIALRGLDLPREPRTN